MNEELELLNDYLKKKELTCNKSMIKITIP